MDDEDLRDENYSKNSTDTSDNVKAIASKSPHVVQRKLRMGWYSILANIWQRQKQRAPPQPQESDCDCGESQNNKRK
eukprot:12697635-Ditylum_brightwellii.AAC.1